MRTMEKRGGDWDDKQETKLCVSSVDSSSKQRHIDVSVKRCEWILGEKKKKKNKRGAVGGRRVAHSFTPMLLNTGFLTFFLKTLCLSSVFLPTLSTHNTNTHSASM